ncbi:MAG TPA: DUF935 family protein [Fermentimonas sp.]|nr:DUF935 family protein [Fermentimonas sp.]
MAKQQKKENKTVISQIVIKSPQRKVFDVGEWRNALISADAGRVKRLFDMFEDLLIDGYLSDAFSKRKDAVTNSELTFQNNIGELNDEMMNIIDTLEFERLLNLIMDTIGWGRTGIEFDFSDGLKVYEIPKKHINLVNRSILINESDESGIAYKDDDHILILGEHRKYGLFMKTAPYVIWKRGGFGDWAQWLEIFGMPQRVGKYSMQDEGTRRILEQALAQAGSAPYIVIPKESEVETVNNTGSGSSSASYGDFRKACNEELLITMLGQTLTTIQGDKGARSLGEVHQKVEGSKNRADMRYVQRVLNQYVLPLFERYGLPVKGGKFIFPEASEQLKVSEIISLSKILPIPQSYLYDKYSIPAPTGEEPVAGSKQEKVTEEKQPEVEEQPAEDKPKKKLGDFFADAPTKERGNKSFINKLKEMLTGTRNLADNNKYGIDLEKLFQEALNEVYDNAKNEIEQPIVSKPLFTITNTAINTGIDEEFGPEFGKTNKEFINEFRKNNAVFSAFKNHKQTEDIIKLLTDDKGELISFRKFRKLALQVSKDYNEVWLQTEYNTAVKAARSAANYIKMQEAKDIYPNLEYIKTTASHPRELHLEWVGTILPIDHPWWQTHMPPSDWNCSCSVKQTDKDVTEVPEGDANPIFQNNPGETAEFIKIEETSYFKETKKEDRKKVEVIALDLFKEVLDEMNEKEKK